MKLDDHDPLFSEWSRSEAWKSAESPSATPSLAPHAISIDDGEAEGLYGPVARPVSPEHRQKLQRYVKATVAACVVLCVAAIGRVGLSRVLAAHEADAPTTLAAAHAPDVSPPPSLAVAPPVAAPVAAAPPVAVAAPAPVTPAAPPAAAPKTGLQERESARRSLERGKLRDAIDAGERATTLDPTDAESWLILGAAHQELGHGGAARTAFRACVKSANRGPVRECRAMLR